MVRVFLFLVIVFLSSVALAEEGPKENTPLTRLDAASKRMLEGLDQNQTKQFAAIRTSHGVIRAVEDTEHTMAQASESCARNNPDMADEARGRIAHFKSEIDPVLDDARGRLNTMVKLQSFANLGAVRGYLRMVDDAVAFKARGIKSIPIVSQDECKRFFEKTEESEEDVKNLLIETLGLNQDIQLQEKR